MRILRPFDIEEKKRGGIGGSNWNESARNHFKDGDNVTNHFGAILSSDGEGVLGRYSWDPKQASLGIMTHGKVRIKGKNKLDFSECSSNVNQNQNTIQLKEVPDGWKIGDKIFLAGTDANKQNEVLTINNISGNTITTVEQTRFDHTGATLSGVSYYTYVANLTRNITFKSTNTNTQIPTLRGHVMFMFNGDVKVENTLFKDLGRTDKSNMVDDIELGISEITGSGNTREIEFSNFTNRLESDPSKIENQRGRYGLHFHKTLRGNNSTQLVTAKGNVVWGSPGWGMVHHDSHAEFIDNVVVDVEGGAMVAESGSETGIWKHNFASSDKVDNTSPLLNNEPMTSRIRRELRVRIDDDFRGLAGFCLQGRAVIMKDNVAGAIGIGYHYQGSGIESIVADELNTSIFEANGVVNPFPFQETVVRTAPQFIKFDNNIAFNVKDGFKSQNRSKSGAFNRVSSVISNLVVWNASRFGIYMSTNFAYLIRNSKVHSLEIQNPSISNKAVLIQKDNDNLNFHNVDFYNYKRTGVSLVNGDQNISQNNANARFVFNKVQWLDSPNAFDPYTKNINNMILITDIEPDLNYQVSFEKDNNIDDQIDLGLNDYKFTIKGKVTDQVGVSSFANYAPKANPTLERVYEFENENDIRSKFLDGRPLLSDNRGNYVEFIEYMSDRLLDTPTAVKIKIYVKGYTLSNKNINNIKEFKIFPNPSSDIITIITTQTQSINEITIYDINGKKVYKSEYDNLNTVNINVSHLNVGIYIIKTNNFNSTFVKK